MLTPFVAAKNNTTSEVQNSGLFVCYGKIEPSLVKGYELVILESEHYNKSDVEIFKKYNKKVIAYISITEVNENAKIYKEVQKFTVGKNTDWNSHYLDLGNYETKIALYSFASKMFRKGFDGLFLDNLDNVSKWGNLKNQKSELIALIKELRKRHSNMFLMQNAGLFLANEIKDDTDAILVESVFSNYNLKKNKPELRNKNQRKQILNQINKALKVKDKPIFLLEYTNISSMKIRLEKELIKRKLPYFIANIDLQSSPKFN